MREQEVILDTKYIPDKELDIPLRQDVDIPDELIWESPVERQKALRDYGNPWLAKDCWKKMFKHHMFKDYTVCHLAETEIEEAAKRGIQLEAIKVNALVSHYVPRVARLAGEKLKLTKGQREFLDERPDLTLEAKKYVALVQVYNRHLI
jgi:hypothetical protein